MMMTTRELVRRRQSRSPIIRALVIVAFCLLLVLLGSFWNHTLGRVALGIASPFLRAGNYLTVKIQNLGGTLANKQNLAAENFKLKQRLLELEAALSDHQALEVDNQTLRSEIGLTRTSSKITIAEVWSHPWNSPFDVILANLPENSSVAIGAQVTFNQNVLAGEVINRAGRLIKIKLISAPDYSLPVLIGPNNISALASGRGNGNLQVILPRNLEIKVGESVTGADSTVPLTVGTVGAVEKDEGESLQTILIQTPINLAFVRYLEIHGQ